MKPCYRHKRSPHLVVIAIVTLLNWAVISAYSVPCAPASPIASRRQAARVQFSDIPPSGFTQSDRENEIRQALDRIPAYFEPIGLGAGGGQGFVSRGSSYSLFIKPSETDLLLHPANASDLATQTEASGKGSDPTVFLPGTRATAGVSKQALIRMRLVGGNQASHLLGAKPLPTRTAYFIGNDPSKWRTNVLTYTQVCEQNVYPGIDRIFYGSRRRLEYDFVVKPGSNPDRITMRFDGATAIRIDDGDLVLTTAAGELRQARPVAYQEANGIKTRLAAKYELKGRHRVGIKLGPYDRSRQVVIDPAIIYSTFFGGGIGSAGGITVDSAGNAYFVGESNADFFVPTPGAFSSGSGNTNITYIAKLDPTGRLIYSAMLGGTNQGEGTYAFSIAIDAAGNAYICGETLSHSFPVTAGAFQASNPSQAQYPVAGFVSKLNPAGSALVYSTYLGGSANSSGLAIAVDSSGSAYVTVSTSSQDFPTTAGAFQRTKGASTFSSCAVTKLNSEGTALSYSTFLSGSLGQGYDVGYGIAVDSGGNAYVTGITYSSDFPTTPGAIEPVKHDPSPTHETTFVSKLNPSGTGLVYSTFLGHRSAGSGIAVDGQGSAYVTGVDYGDQSFPTGPFAISTDGGQTWSAASNGLPAKYMITPPAIDPVNPATIYAALENEGLFKTIDRGGHWTRLTNGLPAVGYFVGSIAVDPVTPTTVYAGVASVVASGLPGPAPPTGVYKSTNAGDSWTFMSSVSDGFDIRIDPHNTSTIYSQKDGVGPIKSIDGGSTWTLITNGLPSKLGVSTIAIDPEHPSTLYLGGGTSIYKSDDGGNNWRQVEDQSAARSLAVDPTNSSIVYALLAIEDSAASGDHHGNPKRHIASADPPLAAVIKSVDAGTDWSSAVQGIPNLPALYRLAIDPLSTSTVYVGTSAGVYRTTDGGQNWKLISTLGPADAFGVLPDPKTEGIIYVGGAMVDLPSGHLFADKISPDGSTLSYSKTISGNHAERGSGIVVDSTGNAYLTGVTDSSDFPTVGAFQSKLTGGSNAVIVKLDPTGQIAFSSFLGGSESEGGSSIAVDVAGDIYVTGSTFSPDFPLVAPVQAKFPAGHNGLTPYSAFITKISAPGAAPKVVSAQKQGKSLWVYGSGFAQGAVIVVSGNQLNTTNDSQNPDTTLMSKKGGKKIKPGEAASIQVMNPDGTMSNTISFTPGN